MLYISEMGGAHNIRLGFMGFVDNYYYGPGTGQRFERAWVPYYGDEKYKSLQLPPTVFSKGKRTAIGFYASLKYEYVSVGGIWRGPLPEMKTTEIFFRVLEWDLIVTKDGIELTNEHSGQQSEYFSNYLTLYFMANPESSSAAKRQTIRIMGQVSPTNNTSGSFSVSFYVGYSAPGEVSSRYKWSDQTTLDLLDVRQPPKPIEVDPKLYESVILTFDKEDKARITLDRFEKLKNWVKTITNSKLIQPIRKGYITITLVGHASPTADNLYNTRKVQERLDEVKALLVTVLNRDSNTDSDARADKVDINAINRADDDAGKKDPNDAKLRPSQLDKKYVAWRNVAIYIKPEDAQRGLQRYVSEGGKL